MVKLDDIPEVQIQIQIQENDEKTTTTTTNDKSELKIVDNENKKKVVNKDRGYLCGTIFYLIVFFILLIVFPLSAIIVIVVNEFHGSIGTIVALCLLIFQYSTVIISLSYILSKTNRLKLHHSDNASSSIGDSISIADVGRRYFEVIKANLMIYTFLVLLGLGDSVFDLSLAADGIIQIINKNYTGDLEFAFRIISIVEEFMKSVYHLNILLFIIYHKNYKKIIVNSLKVKYFIILLSLSCLIQWIFIIFQELNHESLSHSTSTESSNITAKAESSSSSTSSTKLKLLHRYEAFLFPLGIEFRIACFIELMLISLTMSQKQSHNNRGKKDDKSKLLVLFQKIEGFFIKATNKTYFITSYLINKIPIKNVNIVKKFRFILVEQFVAYNITTMTIIVVCSGIVIVLFQDVNVNSNQIMIFEINEICELLIISATLVYTIFLFVSVIRRSRLKSETDLHVHAHNLNLEKKVDFIILHISNIALVTFCVLSAAGGINSFWFNQNEADFANLTQEYDYETELYKDEYIPSHVKYITVVASVLPCIQSIFQIMIAWLCANKVNTNRNYLKALVVFNLTLWIFETFSSTKYQKNEIQRMTYGNTNWEILSAVFIPLSIFYRFHSCLMLIKIKAHKYLID